MLATSGSLAPSAPGATLKDAEWRYSLKPLLEAFGFGNTDNLPLNLDAHNTCKNNMLDMNVSNLIPPCSHLSVFQIFFLNIHKHELFIQ